MKTVDMKDLHKQTKSLYTVSMSSVRLVIESTKVELKPQYVTVDLLAVAKYLQ